MNISTAGLCFGLVSLAAMIVPAEAADMSGRGNGGGSYKDYGNGATPVPAPIPYENHYKWYVSGGIGWTGYSSGSVSASPGLISKDFDELTGAAVVSGAIGRYLTPSIRLELGMDLRTKQKVVNGTSNYQTRAYAPGREQTVTHTDIPTGTVVQLYTGPSQNYNIYNVQHSEEAHAQTHTFMLNGYYEFNRGGKFRPYVGAGVGVAMHMLTRQFTEIAVCDGTNGSRGGNDVFEVYGVTMPTTCWNDETLPARYNSKDGASGTGWGIAAALMAGGTYDLSERTHLDLGYRAIWQGGKAIVSAPSVSGLTTVEIGARLDHEIRTGIRFDIW